ncbi:GcrA family cell cycle regulator [Methylorubrum extorquens]|uniref:GcrA family cell cycle regulator n=1 Tax=Methylorubrum extorquens TaxID=408 RepID=UPI00288C3A14|nr:GcrA family cell cycle regulator [Methylorubrum extorquens]
MRWPAEAKARVSELWLGRQMPAVEIAGAIAAEFGIPASKSAVIGIAFRAGLSFQGRLAASPIRPRRVGPPAPRVRKPRPARPRAEAAPKPPKPAPIPKRVPPGPVGIPESLQVSIVEIREGQCKYMAGDPRDPLSSCCGHPTASGSPWCPGHRAVCTTPSTGRIGGFMPSFRRAA